MLRPGVLQLTGERTRQRVLILCTGNSARSQMAEGLLRALAQDRFEVHSAGTHPSAVRREAIAVLHELGIDISGQRSKHVDELAGQTFDLVLTVCDNVRESCPIFPDGLLRIHRGFSDPARVEGSDAARFAAFRDVRDAIRASLEELIRTELAGAEEARGHSNCSAGGCRNHHLEEKAQMTPKNTICLWYDKDAHAAARFYAATFPDSKVTAVHKAPSDFPGGRKGDELTVEFTVCGIPCIGLNGGPEFPHSEAFSFQIATDDQEETDRYWNAIVGNGGKESQCGWCKDRWGLNWQITPRVLIEALETGGAEAKRAFDAMMTMQKIDVAAIEAARRG